MENITIFNNNPCVKGLNQLICHLNCNSNQRKYIRILNKSKSREDKYQAEIISVTVNIEDMNKLYNICSNAFTPKITINKSSFYELMKSINNSLDFTKIIGDSFPSLILFNVNDNGNLIRLQNDSKIKIIGSVPEALEFEFDTIKNDKLFSDIDTIKL